MWLLVPFLLQAAQAQPLPRPALLDLLRAEHARGTDARTLDAALDAALVGSDTALQRVAVRALGRFEQAAFAPRVVPLLSSPAVSVRREAATALGQMRARTDLAARLASERDPSVRAVLYETVGRIPTDSTTAADLRRATDAATARLLVTGLEEPDPMVRAGAARGLESLLRRTARVHAPDATVLGAIRAAVRTTTASETRQLLLLALTAANDRDSATVTLALRDTSAQVRRVAVALGRRWTDDAAPMVRWQALRVAGTCARATAHTRDSSDHVALLAIDLLGEQTCTDAPSLAALEAAAAPSTSWRHQAHAAVALARVAPARARAVLPRLAAARSWQARVYAAQVARVVQDSATLRQLATDGEPNVAIAAMHTTAHALRALEGTHAGLALAAASFLKGSPALAASLMPLRASFMRFTAMDRVTLRDPRIALLERIGEIADGTTTPWLYDRLRDRDPAVAALAARLLTSRTGAPVAPVTTRYVPAPFPAAAEFTGLDGATATMRLRGIGTVEIALRVDDAPMAIHTFATLADAGKFNGLTFHRIVPNFVIQGGSPGADEYDPITDTFMRDEVGLARNARGSFGISTRGRDTGDGQIYVNLVDNMRLDHDYTVFANVTRGLALIDRVQEGDVIESITVRRATTSTPRRP